MMEETQVPHKPVMVTPLLTAMQGKTQIVDATFGAGGHSSAMLQDDPTRQVIAFDQDPNVLPHVTALQNKNPERLIFSLVNFSEIVVQLQSLNIENVDGVLLDLGVSSMQLDQPERGFSFRANGPLSMRMSGSGPTAEDVVNESSPEDLLHIIRSLGEEPMARTIVKNIVKHRARERITTTTQLAKIIHQVKERRGAKIDPATLTFQALRMHVNDELGALQKGLEGAEEKLRPGGVLAVISFHSLEDRLVKRFLRARAEQPQNSRHLPPVETPPASFRLMRQGAIKASTEEILENPRARSARLRLAERTNAGSL